MLIACLAWLTDIHLDAVQAPTYEQFVEELRSSEADALLITGDIAEGFSVVSDLERLTQESSRPAYVILGNHDFYGREIGYVRRDVNAADNVTYLTLLDEPVALTSECCLIGDDGWADGLDGDFLSSPIRLRDYREITDLSGLHASDLKQKLAELGAEAAARLRPKLERAVAQYQSVIIAVHAPPFRENCLYANQVANDEWAPHFVSKQIGDLLLEFADAYPEQHFDVYCGHSHHAADTSPRPNLRVQTGAAEYGSPVIQQLLHFDR